MRSLRSFESFTVVALALLLGCQCASTALAQDELTFEPYSVFVAEKGSYAHCGPSDDYYRTDPLRYGQTLDVYAETDNGWLGIRPPAESFCWIPADTVEIEDAAEDGTIIEDRTVAWIGTHLGRARKYRWQVQLAKGEPVTVIGRSEREGPDGPQLWYRIVPPSGEYRWIHRDSIVMTSEELVETVRQEAEPKSMARTEPSAPRDNVAASASASNSVQQSGSRSRPENAASQRDVFEQQANASNGESILDRGVDRAADSERAIGSGLTEEWSTPRTDGNGGVAQASGVGEPQTAVDAFKQGGLLASLEFLTRPKLQEIGQPQTAHHTASNNESNWVSGDSRLAQQGSRSSADLGTPISVPSSLHPNQNSIMQASAQSRAGISNDGVSPASHAFNVVSAERITQIEAEAGNADIDRLNLILSRLMASQASAAEAEPIELAARQMANSASDSLTAGRARMLAETAERYRRIATRRDGQSIIQTNATVPLGPAGVGSSAGSALPPGLPAAAGSSSGTGFTSQAIPNRVPAIGTQIAPTPPSLMSAPIAAGNLQSSQPAASADSEFRRRSVAPAPRSTPGSTSRPAPTIPPRNVTSTTDSHGGTDRGNGVIQHGGYLVQVYSARSNSPPFALTDTTGRTVAYVTPSPGVNLRTHLNSRINVVGTRGFLTGLNTPHILVTQAVRTPE